MIMIFIVIASNLLFVQLKWYLNMYTAWIDDCCYNGSVLNGYTTTEHTLVRKGEGEEATWLLKDFSK